MGRFKKEVWYLLMSRDDDKTSKYVIAGELMG